MSTVRFCFLPLRWKTLAAAIVACLAVTAVLLWRSRALHAENSTLSRLQFTPAAQEIDSAGRLAALESDNQRLRTELAEIPVLAETTNRLRQQIAAEENQNAADWKNALAKLDSAIEQERSDLKAIAREEAQQMRELSVRAARQRLTERAAEGADDSVLNERLKKLATARNEMLAARKDWTEAQKSEGDHAEAAARLRHSKDSWSAALNDLGKDSALFHYLPLPPRIDDPATVPFMQSVLPDRRGLFATVYLDGTIIAAPARSEPQP